MNEQLICLILNGIAVPFGFLAMYYGYKGYVKTKGGLKAFMFFLLAMTFLGATGLADLLAGMDVLPYHYPVDIGILLIAIFLMLAFKDLDDFLSKNF